MILFSIGWTSERTRMANKFVILTRLKIRRRSSPRKLSRFITGGVSICEELSGMLAIALRFDIHRISGVQVNIGVI